jgi:hypothetical protein
LVRAFISNLPIFILRWPRERATGVSTMRRIIFRTSPAFKRLHGLAGVLILCSLIPAEALACACGCAVFDVGSSALLPKEGDHGGAVYFEWDHSNQDMNWHDASKASSSLNSDKHIETEWYVVGLNYMFNRDWGLNVRIPSADRTFTTQDFGPYSNPSTGNSTYRTGVLGDIEVSGMYTGFSGDMSKGIMFGLKLPTGDWRSYGFDRDSNVGTGSTDLILGGYWRGLLTGDNSWQYFAQSKVLIPLLTHGEGPDTYTFGAAPGDYRPGWQVDTAAGLVYNNWYNVGVFDKIAPVFQIIYSHRQEDGGAAAADPIASGFDRVFISPGIDFTKVIDDANNNTLKLYGDIEIPVYQRVKGDQLVSPYLTKVILAYTF